MEATRKQVTALEFQGPGTFILKDPVPREFSDLMSPFLYSATTTRVIAGTQVVEAPAQVPAQVPQRPQQSGGAAYNSWLD